MKKGGQPPCQSAFFSLPNHFYQLKLKLSAASFLNHTSRCRNSRSSLESAEDLLAASSFPFELWHLMVKQEASGQVHQFLTQGSSQKAQELSQPQSFICPLERWAAAAWNLFMTHTCIFRFGGVCSVRPRGLGKHPLCVSLYVFFPSSFCYVHNLTTSAQSAHFSPAAAICTLLRQHIFLYLHGAPSAAQTAGVFLTCALTCEARAGVTADTGEPSSALIIGTWSAVTRGCCSGAQVKRLTPYRTSSLHLSN